MTEDIETYNKTFVTSKDSDQPVHPPSVTRVIVYQSLDSPEAVKDTCDQQRLTARKRILIQVFAGRVSFIEGLSCAGTIMACFHISIVLPDISLLQLRMQENVCYV